jgi:hypothetical protein
MNARAPFSKATVIVVVARRASITTTDFPARSFFSNSCGLKARSIFIWYKASLIFVHARRGES